MLSATTSLIAQKIVGNVVDVDGKPIPYVNVVLLNTQDSTFIEGTISGQNGEFSLNDVRFQGLLKLSSIGYQTLFINCKGESNLGKITLLNNAYNLDSVVVKSKLPKTIVRDGGVFTTVSGTILEKMGTIYNLLDKIPQLIVQDNKIKVFGRGEPIFYLDGRLMKDLSELERLQSEDVKSVEVINNPGAGYGASVKAVVRISLKKKKGEGFGANVRSYGAINEKYRTSGYGQLNLDFLKTGLGISATLYSRESHRQDDKDIQQYTFSDNTWSQVNNIKNEGRYQQIYSRFEVTYQINSNNSIGTSLSYNRMPSNKNNTNMTSKIFKNIQLTENSYSNILTPEQVSTVSNNIYYVGKIGKVGLDFNFDWLWNKKKEISKTHETYKTVEEERQNILVCSKNNTKNRLAASKLVVTIPCLKGVVSLGGEYSKCNRDYRYIVEPKDILEDNDGIIKESLASGFIEYRRNFGILKLQLGLRYEHANYNYHENQAYELGLNHVYRNFLPSLMLNLPIGDWQMQLGYGTDIQRPTYYAMRNSIQYDNKYTYEAGNPYLVSQISRNVNYDISYKWMSANIMYSHVSDPLLLYSQPYENNPQVAMLQTVNWSSFDLFTASLNFSPKIGIWSPACRMMVQKQWLDMNTHDNHELGHLLANFRITNTFDTKFFTATLGFNVQTTGDDMATYYNKGYFCANLSIYKSLLKRRLTIYFDAYNLFGTGNSSSRLYSGTMREIRYHNFSTSEYSLTISYSFNSIKNKYKGKGSGKEQRQRL